MMKMNMSQAGRLSDSEPGVVEVLREFEEVDRYYREAIAAMRIPGSEIAPTLSSADVTLLFQPTVVTIDLSRSED